MQPLEVEDAYAADEKMSWGDFCASFSAGIKEKSGKDWAITLARIVGICTCLYFFLFSLDLMGGAFKVLGGCSAGGMFEGANNPIAGLMIGILATVLVQSSSTSTSIVVALVGEGLDVNTAVFIIMGANIGTSVTNTIVSMGQITDVDQYERAFGGATVHDMFNFLAVAILLPVEAATGMLVALTSAMKPESVVKDEKWVGPVKKWVGPLTKVFLSADKKVIQKISLGQTTCEETYEKVAKGTGPCGDGKATGLIKCSCNDDGSIEQCPAFYTKSGSLADDYASGGIALALSIIFLCICLAFLVKILQSMVLGSSSRMIRKATSLNGYLAMLIGVGITILVQSSSVTTSVLTPLVGVGVLPIEKMFPLTLGANIGTTATAIMASLVSSSPDSVQIALCHLFFNLIGILIWYPIPFMRRIPINLALSLGKMARRYRLFPVFYILTMFAAIPGILLGISVLIESRKPGYLAVATLILCVLVFGLIAFLIWWFKRDGREKFFIFLQKRQERNELMNNLQTTIEDLNAKVDALTKGTDLEKKEKTLATAGSETPPSRTKEAFLEL